MKKIIVTGAYGFLGRNCIDMLKNNNFEIYAIGHGQFTENECIKLNIKRWISSDVSFDALCELTKNESVDAIIHCAGGSSVLYSVNYPSLDFKKTVESTNFVLEYIRLKQPNAKLIYPSSAAVYGNVLENECISETYSTNPISPYGYHKLISELLCKCYSQNYNIRCVVLRFFSLYGEGLKKQIIWDICNKIINANKVTNNNTINLFGTGNETRDFLHVSDAVNLILYVVKDDLKSNFEVINAGFGVKTKISELVDIIFNEFKNYGINNLKVNFNNIVKSGDPKHYWANINYANSLGWYPKITINEGIKLYIKWFLENYNLKNY